MNKSKCPHNLFVINFGQLIIQCPEREVFGLTFGWRPIEKYLPGQSAGMRASILEGESISVSSPFISQSVCCHPNLFVPLTFGKKLCTVSFSRPHAGYGDGIGNGIEDFKVNDPDDGMLGGLHV